jgi:hypothetical protein
MKNTKTKQLLFPAIAGMAALIGSMNEGFGASEQGVFQVDAGGGVAPAITATFAAGTTAATTSVAVPANLASTTSVAIISGDSSVLAVTNAITLASRTTLLSNTNDIIWNTLGSNASGTVTLTVTLPICGSTLTFYDVGGGSGARTFTPSAAATVASAWDDTLQNKQLTKPFTVFWFGPKAPSYTAQMGGVVLKYKAKTQSEMMALAAKAMAS